VKVGRSMPESAAACNPIGKAFQIPPQATTLGRVDKARLQPPLPKP
jgi:hypothetical protein